MAGSLAPLAELAVQRSGVNASWASIVRGPGAARARVRRSPRRRLDLADGRGEERLAGAEQVVELELALLDVERRRYAARG